MTVQTPHALVAVLIGLPVVLIWLRSRRGLSAGHLVAMALFAFYLLGVLSYTVFPLWFDAEYRAEVQLGNWTPVLVPFFLSDGDVMTRAQALGNIILGVPFGFGLPFVWRGSLRRVLVAGLLFSVSIEATQFVLNTLGIAFPVRAVDINDVLLNTLGAAVGALGFVMVRGLYGSRFGRVSASIPVWSHFHGVFIARMTRARPDTVTSGDVPAR